MIKFEQSLSEPSLSLASVLEVDLLGRLKNWLIASMFFLKISIIQISFCHNVRAANFCFPGRCLSCRGPPENCTLVMMYGKLEPAWDSLVLLATRQILTLQFCLTNIFSSMLFQGKRSIAWRTLPPFLPLNSRLLPATFQELLRLTEDNGK
jgi:hypothetical protein